VEVPHTQEEEEDLLEEEHQGSPVLQFLVLSETWHAPDIHYDSEMDSADHEMDQ